MLRSVIIITVRHLGEGFTGSIDDISNEEFWKANNSNDVVRYIPLSGWIDSYNEVQGRGSDARFFSRTSTGQYCWYSFFTSYSMGLMDSNYDWYYTLTDRYTVRLFED